MRLVATSMLLTALAFVSQPGRIVGDTKADLALNPGGFLERALSLWDPAGSFGQVQNQAYGYLFPMGPFFWLGHLTEIDPWIVQRLWWSLLFVTAFLGMVKLAGVLGLGTPTARLLGGLAFALSPRMLSLVGSSSIEVWPSALAPWVLVPLVIGLRRGNPRLMAALSALAVACIGGVNAAATFAVLPLGMIWLLMAQPSRRRRSLIVWWPAFVALGTLWWLGPLLLLGSYSPPFLDFIESASTTTFAATAFDALRGTSNWIPYLDSTAVAGSVLLTSPAVIINSVVVLVLGIWGIGRKDNPIGRFLLVSLAVGLTLVTFGHAGTNLGTTGLQGLLDGVLAPLRNTHKFDPVIRVPLVLGLVHVVGVYARRSSDTSRRRLPLAGVALLAGAALFGSTVPAWTADLANRGTYTDVPGYWTDATDWLNKNAVGQNTLLLPGSPFGTYLWGSPRDEVAQAFLSSPWSVRNAVPLTPPGTIRTLDTFERAFASGVGSRALHDALFRSGIRYLLVRQDLADSATTDTELVESTLRSTPGVVAVKSFGPMVGNPASQETDDGEVVFVNAGRQSRHRAIQVFEVEGVDSTVARVQPVKGTPVVIGSPDALLVQDGLFDQSTDVLLAADTDISKPQGPVIMTDTDRRQEVAFGRVIRNRSASLGHTDRYRIDRPVHDYVVPGQARWQTVPELIGAASISASSSQSDVTQFSIDQTRQPWSAFDGDSRTKWVAGDSGSRAWVEVRFAEPTSVTGLSVTLTRGQPARELSVTTDVGTETTKVQAGESEAPLDTPVGLTRSLRISGPSFGLEPLSIDDVSIPEAPLARPLRLPALPESWGIPDDILFTAPAGQAACRTVQGVVRCTPGRDGLGEDGRTIDRIVELAGSASYASGLSAAPQESAALTNALSGDVRLRVSSTGSGDAAAGILAAIDGDPQTGWIAALRDVTPEITLTFPTARTMDRLVLRADPTLAASAPQRARLVFDDGTSRRVRFDTDGVAEFPAKTSKSVTIEVTDAYVRSSLAFDGTGSGLPLGISEISVPGSGRALSAGTDKQIELPCGSGPTVAVDSRTFETSVTTSRRAVLSHRPLTTSLCGLPDLVLAKGSHRVTVSPSVAFRPLTVRFSRTAQAHSAGVEVDTERTGSHIEVAAVAGSGEQILTLNQNVNRGWRAGDSPAVTVNGWQQGFEVEGGKPIDVSFGPSLLYRGLLALGALAMAGLLISVWRLRRSPDVVDEPRTLRTRLRGFVGAVTAIVPIVLVGGIGGTLAAVLALAAVLLVGRRWDASWVAPAAVLVAGLAYVVRPWASSDAWAGSLDWPQWCVVAALAAAGGVLFDREIWAFLRRMAGRSTTR
ncbi:arabinofuranan 3-O-arabinosyltransferase [Aeromicrobium panaciterrae]|uniref:Arabinofuranan 3-O-arabinosyltransferase n=1 Tax=Aeromicrobium panaciterrae TaxID=363861 RepID=A0ABU1UPI5_9ACTN|nr:alpha-(1->3)-arabinofuranosyltransferase family protein [Aeromicrobium panaciterrae]MDR7087089.1 arabinofuranan 3-O-arabinosyltransferase [Aeromicrobium panaciterrae]